MVNGTGSACDAACYENVKFKVVGDQYPYTFKIHINGFGDEYFDQCANLSFIVYKDGDNVAVNVYSLADNNRLHGVHTTPIYEFYRTIYDRSTVSKIINNSGIEIGMNSSAKKNGYGKIDLTIPAYTHGTVSNLSGGALGIITVPDETVGAGAIEFFIKRNNKDNRYEIYSMSGGYVHLRGPDAAGNWGGSCIWPLCQL